MIAAGIKIYGLIIQILRTTEVALNIPYAIIGNKNPKMKSIVTMSLENLVIILPIGFESKKRILALKTLSDIALCIFVALNIIISEINTDLRTESTMNATIAIPKFLG